MPGFVHLRLHTDYSLVDGMVRIGPLIETCIERQMPAVAVTDESNLFGLIKFYSKAIQAGLKPLAGADLWLESRYLDEPARLTLLIQNNIGYANLRVLISRGWQENQHRGRAVIRREWLEELHQGMIMLSGARQGEIGQLLLLGRDREALDLARNYQQLAGDRFYLEVQRTDRTGDEDCLHATVKLAQQLELPVVATNDVRFLRREDFEAHEARVCIHDGHTLDDPRRPRKYSEEQYLKSAAEMAELFQDLPEALQNTVEIARRCTLDIELGKNYLPDFPVPEGDTIEGYIGKLSRQGLEKRLAMVLDKNADDYQQHYQHYEERLDFELKIINQMGFPGYFLIVSDFIRWAKENEVPVGPGRGSGAGSLVAWVLEITDLDPIAYDLLFERFLNPERISMPDFDVDFCMEKRDRVIAYVADKYGRDAVGQIITFGTMAARAVVRDVARVQGKPYGLADRMSKMIPGTPGMTLEKALQEEPALAEFIATTEGDGQAAGEIWEMALKLEGLSRNAGKHAGGVVIAPTTLTDFAPLYCDEHGDNLVTQYDKDDVEAAGLVKFDFLGLKTLTIIDWAVKAANLRRQRLGEEPINIDAISLEDSTSFDLLKRGDTTAVFQLESQGMKELIKKLRPDVFEEIIALVALYRPGPLESGMVDNFIKRKHGLEAVSYPDPDYQHELLKPILEPTYGVILYQEQVMQIAQVLAGYTLGEADVLRRAMGKKKVDAMDQEEESFAAGAKAQDVDPDLATKIFELVRKFAGYGFNKSHSAAYALVAYQTAWLKAHYPAEFMAAVISADMHNTDKVVTFIDECHALKINVLPPDVNSCGYRFTVNLEGDVIYGLGAIKGLGEGPIESIVTNRPENGFQDLFDFCQRVDLRKVNKRALESLVRAGALDKLGPNKSFNDRATLMATLADAIQLAEQEAHNTAAGMQDLFGDVADEADQHSPVHWREARQWKTDTRLDAEKDTLGLFLTGHPIDPFEQEVGYFVTSRLNAVQPTGKGEMATVAGLIVDMRIVRSKKTGDRMGFLTLDDKTGRVEISVFGEVFSQYGDLLEKGGLLVARGSVRTDDHTGGFKLVAAELMDMATARETWSRRLTIEVKLEDHLPERLQHLLQPWKGGHCPVVLHLLNNKGRGTMTLGDEWQVRPEEQLLDDLRHQFGAQQVRLEY